MADEENTQNADDTSGAGDDEKKLANLVNSVVTSQLKRALPKALNEGLAEFSKGLDEKFGELAKKLTPAAAGKPPEGEQKPKPDERDARLAELEKRVSQSEEEARTLREANAKAAREQRESAALQQLQGLLSESIPNEAVRATVVRDLFYGQKRVNIDDDGNVTMRVGVAPYKGGKEEDTDLDLKEAVSVFLGSNEAKPFLPAPGGAGGAAPAGGVIPRAKSAGKGPLPEGDPEARAAERIQRLGLTL